MHSTTVFPTTIIPHAPTPSRRPSRRVRQHRLHRAQSRPPRRHDGRHSLRRLRPRSLRLHRPQSRHAHRDAVSHSRRLAALHREPARARRDRAGEPTLRIEITGDSIGRSTPTRTWPTKATPGVYYAPGFTPYDQARLARHLLRQTDHSAKLNATRPPRRHHHRGDGADRARQGAACGSSPSRSNGGTTTPQIVWLDANDELFATEVSWFMTVKPGAEPALPDAAQARGRVPRRAGRGAQHASPEADERNDRDHERRSVRQRARRHRAAHDRHRSRRPHRRRRPGGIDAGSRRRHGDRRRRARRSCPACGRCTATCRRRVRARGGPMQLSFGITTVRDLGSDPDIAIVESRPRRTPDESPAPRDDSLRLHRRPGEVGRPDAESSSAPKTRRAPASRTSTRSATSRSSSTTSSIPISSRRSPPRRTSAACG